MTAYQPAHGHHGLIARARARISAAFTAACDWVYGPHFEQRTPEEYAHDVASQEMGDIFDEECTCGEINSRHCPVHNDEPRPGSEANWVNPAGPGFFHDDAPARVIPTTRVGGVHLPLTDDTVIDVRPQPRAGRSVWAPPRPLHQAWVQRIIDAPLDVVLSSMEAASPDLYLWDWAQRKALAA